MIVTCLGGDLNLTRPLIEDTMARIYTRTGDAGETGLLGGLRVSKSDARIAACGAVDELNAALGVVRAELNRGRDASMASIEKTLGEVQHELFDLGAELASIDGTTTPDPRINTANVSGLEKVIDSHEAMLDPLSAFILPGGSPSAASLHFARCVCRAAERQLVATSQTFEVRKEILQYLNRLSDLLFVLARAANQTAGVADILWRPSTP